MNTLQRRLAEKRANEEAGFTLIELLVVIVILGILAAVVVFSVRGITDRGTNSACKSSRTAILTAAEAFYANEPTTPSVYPADLAAMVTKGYMNGSGVSGADFQGKGFKLTYSATGPTVTADPTTACA